MSLMAMSADSARPSGFTFDSSVHPSNVLHALDEQRRRDVFCDVTVLVEGRSLRAHRSVLASCSEWFTSRVSSHSTQGLVITLPEEVTCSGFEPLLNFAYTSKLHFSKDTVFEIRNCATILGFRDLDKACFDFLLPKFFHDNRGPAPRKACCMKKCKRLLPRPSLCDNDTADEKQISKTERIGKVEVSTVTPPRNQSENADTGSKSQCLGPSSKVVVQSETDYSLQCPKYRKFQLACGKEACGSGRSRDLQAPGAVQEGYYVPCSVARVCGQALEVEQSPKGSFCHLDTRTGRRTDVEECYPAKMKAERVQEDLGENAERRRKSEKGQGSGEAQENTWQSPARVKEGRGKAEGKEGVVPERSGQNEPPTVKPRSDENVGGERSRVERGGEPCHPDRIRQPSQGRRDHEKEEDTRKQRRDMSVEEGQDVSVKGRKDISVKGRKDISVKEGKDVSVKEKKDMSVNGRKDGRTKEKEDVTVYKRGDLSIEEKEELSCSSSSSSLSWSLSSVSLKDSGGPEAEVGAGRGSCSSPCRWMKLQRDLGNSTDPAPCPFLLDLEPGESAGPEGGPEDEDRGPFGHPAEDGESEAFDTDGDSGSCSSEGVRQVKLPFSVGLIATLNRNDFQQMVKRQSLTRDQLRYVHDLRRRSKNCIAARRCRKRKLEGIQDLECEINKLMLEKEKLKAEKCQLSGMKEKTRQSMNALCQRLCSQTSLDPEQLHLLANTADCLTGPLGSGPETLLQPQASPSACCSLIPGICQSSTQP